MAGQFKTRRNPDTGRLERIPEEERLELMREAAAAVPAADPRPEPTEQDQRDAEFLDEARAEVPPEAEPVPEIDTGAEEAAETAGQAAGAAVGGKAGAAVGGAAAAFLASKLTQRQPSPIGTLEGGAPSRTGNDDLAELLRVTKEIARAGTPIKNAITTTATDSRL